MAAELVEGRHRGAFVAAAQESLHLLVDDGERARRLLLTGGAAFHRHPFQVAEVVQEHLVEAVDGRLDVARQRGVDQEHRPLATAVERHQHHVGVDHLAAAAERGQQHVRLVEQPLQLVEIADMAVQGPRQGLRPAFVRMHDGEVAQAFAQQLRRHQFAHLAGADQQPRGARQVAMQVAGEPGRGGGDGDRSLADGGLAAHPLGGTVGGLDQRLQPAAGHPGIGGHAVTGLDLAQHLRLADDQAVEGGGDPEHLAHRVGVGKRVGLTGERGILHAGVLGDGGDGVGGGRFRVVVHALHLDAVAGRKHQRMADAGQPEPAEHRRNLALLQEQLVAEPERARTVAEADHERAQGFRLVCRHRAHPTGSGRDVARATKAGLPSARPMPCRAPSPHTSSTRPRLG